MTDIGVKYAQMLSQDAVNKSTIALNKQREHLAYEQAKAVVTERRTNIAKHVLGWLNEFGITPQGASQIVANAGKGAQGVASATKQDYLFS